MAGEEEEHQGMKMMFESMDAIISDIGARVLNNYWPTQRHGNNYYPLKKQAAEIDGQVLAKDMKHSMTGGEQASVSGFSKVTSSGGSTTSVGSPGLSLGLKM